MNYKYHLKKIENHFESRMLNFEYKNSIDMITNAIMKIPSNLLNSSINEYQHIIRCNDWYFPTLNDVNLYQFLVRWREVHDFYFDLAEEIFEQFCSNNYSIEKIASHKLLDKVISSETMRGWVGKRSASGLDSLLHQREEEFTLRNNNLSTDEIDNILFCFGLYHEEDFLSAEQELIRLMSTNSPSNRDVVLRNFCQYNLNSFMQKEKDIKSYTGEFNNTDNTVKSLIQDEWLLDEIRALNYLNLNLEVKYSFKGFAGLMHVLVFYACKLKTSTDNVYEMKKKLI